LQLVCLRPSMRVGCMEKANGTEVIHPIGLQHSPRGTPQHPTSTLNNGAIDRATHE